MNTIKQRGTIKRNLNIIIEQHDLYTNHRVSLLIKNIRCLVCEIENKILLKYAIPSVSNYCFKPEYNE